MSRLTGNLIYSFILILGGCSYASPQWNSEAPYPPSRTPEIGDILHTATGHYINQQELFSSLIRYPLVYVGEQHDNPASHRLQLEVLKAMQARHPGQVALGMEMFHNGQQREQCDPRRLPRINVELRRNSSYGLGEWLSPTG